MLVIQDRVSNVSLHFVILLVFIIQSFDSNLKKNLLILLYWDGEHVFRENPLGGSGYPLNLENTLTI